MFFLFPRLGGIGNSLAIPLEPISPSASAMQSHERFQRIAQHRAGAPVGAGIWANPHKTLKIK